jgi:threonine dehydratase
VNKPLPTLADVRAAHGAITSTAIRTPLILSELSPSGDSPIWLKLECLQPTGSFKIRGATNAIAKLSAGQRRRGVICCSTGNHGRAVAHACREAGISATICLSKLVPQTKVEAIEKLGAKVLRVGNSSDDAQLEVDRLVSAEGMVELPPFDHADVIAGQGTIALELLEERPDLETLLVPLSGGGLISGIAIAAKALKPGIRIVGLSMDRGAAMAESIAAGHIVDVDEVASLADALGGGIPKENRYTFAACREFVDEVVLVTESEIYEGMRALFHLERLVAEGGAAVGHAALIAGKVDVDGPTAIVISGRNVDTGRFADIATGVPVQLGDLRVEARYPCSP